MLYVWATWLVPGMLFASYPGVKDTVRTFWPNGKPREMTVLETDTANQYGPFRNGLQCTWFESGQMESKRRFYQGEPEGWYTRWHPNGQKAEEGSWGFGTKEGTWIVWDDKGNRLEEITYVGGKRHGLAISHGASEFFQIHYKNDQLHGLCRWGESPKWVRKQFYFNGALLVSFLDGDQRLQTSGTQGEYYNDDLKVTIEWDRVLDEYRVGRFQGDKKVGLWHIWTPLGEHAECFE